MSGVNKAIVVGRLGADPEVKVVSNNQSVARLSVATSESWTDKQGQKQERTEWHRVVVWGKMAEIVGKHLSKGRQVYVEGRLQTRSWEDQSGQKRYTTEIVAANVQFLGALGERETSSSMMQANGPGVGASGNPNSNTSMGASSYPEFQHEPSFDAGDEMPF